MVTAVTQFRLTPVVPEVNEMQIVLEVEKGMVTAAYADQPDGLSVLVVDYDAEECGPLPVQDLDALPNVARRLLEAAAEEED